MSDSVPLKSTGAVQLMIASPSSSIYDLKCITGPTLPIKQDSLPYYSYTLKGQSIPSTVIVTVLVSITCAVEFMTMHSTSTLFVSFSGNISIGIRTEDDLLLIYFSVTIPAKVRRKVSSIDEQFRTCLPVLREVWISQLSQPIENHQSLLKYGWLNTYRRPPNCVPRLVFAVWVLPKLQCAECA